MDAATSGPPGVPAEGPPATSPAASRAGLAVWLVLGAIASVQLGGAIGKWLFGSVPPLAAAWLRLASAALMLLVIARPRLRGRSAADWRVGIAYVAGLLLMNITIYEAFARIPLGIAVTIEFLGPLAVAVFGSRRLLDLIWVVLAGLGVALLGWREVPLDPLGVGFALLAAVGWAAYIIAGQKAGRSWDGLTVLTLACVVGGVGFAVPAVVTAGGDLWHPKVLLVGACVGLLSSVLPYSLELVALRHLPTRIFGILMSLDPAAAALFGFVVLSEALSGRDLIAMACVMAASVGALRSQRRAAAG